MHEWEGAYFETPAAYSYGPVILIGKPLSKWTHPHVNPPKGAQFIGNSFGLLRGPGETHLGGLSK